MKNKAHRYINSDYCYPGVLIVGQFLDALENGMYPPDRVAFMEPQAGGACRAGNYYQVIRNTMKKCGHGQVPVISLNYKGQEKQPGFRITPRLFLNAMAAVCFGDLVMSLYQQVKPYELRKGETDDVRRGLEEDLALRYLKKVQREMFRAVEKYGRFETDLSFDELKKRAEQISGCDCITGDGWLVAAEVAEAIERGCRHVLIVHPFGCLVSHVCERGVLNRLKRLYPYANIQTIEYDYDSSDALRESRILMALGEFANSGR